MRAGGRWVVAASTVALVGGRADAADAAPGHHELALAVGLGQGVAPSDDVAKRQVALAWDVAFSPALIAGPELSFGRFHGTRGGAAVDARGGTLTYVVRWRFLRHRVVQLDAHFAFGGALFLEPFPPGGTQLNGTSFIGLGARVRVHERMSLRVSLRQVHHSNGRGLVEDNPAYDGGALDVGLGLAW